MRVNLDFRAGLIIILVNCWLFFMMIEAQAQKVQVGKASYYADKFDGRMTASGAIFRQDSLTAAHPSLPFGTKVKVTNTKNSNTIKVVINDRGPNIPGRIIDLSRKAMEYLGGIRYGIIEVKVEILHD